jgi:hypothetical protein
MAEPEDGSSRLPRRFPLSDLQMRRIFAHLLSDEWRPAADCYAASSTRP